MIKRPALLNRDRTILEAFAQTRDRPGNPVDFFSSQSARESTPSNHHRAKVDVIAGDPFSFAELFARFVAVTF